MREADALVCSLVNSLRNQPDDDAFFPAMHRITSPSAGAPHSDLAGNRLFSALNPSDQNRLAAVATIVQLPGGHILYEPGDVVSAAYFPIGAAIASFHVEMEDGAAIETAMIGREGAVGGIVSQGQLAAYARACVMNKGLFARIDMAALERIKEASPPIRHLLARYADCLLAQVFQSVACNAAHPLEQRAAKWLVSAVERTGLHHVAMTQDQFGSILGVGRSYASRLIQRFKADGLVGTRRAGLLVHDPAGLRQRACGCDDLVRAHFEHVLAGVYPPPPAERLNG